MFIIITIAVFTVALTYFWELLLQQGMLLGFVKQRLATLYFRNKGSVGTDAKLKLAKATQESDDWEDVYDLVKAWWWKPTIGCIYCYNVWISLGTLLLLPTMSFFGWVYVVILSNLIVRYLYDKV